jgi:hypothetical protein
MRRTSRLTLYNSFPFEQHVKPAVAEAPPLSGKLAQPRPDLRIVRLRGAAHRLGIDQRQGTGPPLREASLRELSG